MTIAERIDALEKELAELKEKLKTDVLKEYREFSNEAAYLVTNSDEITPCLIFSETLIDGYYRYHTREYAEMAKEMKEFNDKLLAFKWCYDRDYVPDWDDENNIKYVVVYDNQSERYRTDSRNINKYSTVHFSTAEIAKKCCDWLNGMMGD